LRAFESIWFFWNVFGTFLPKRKSLDADGFGGVVGLLTQPNLEQCTTLPYNLRDSLDRICPRLVKGKTVGNKASQNSRCGVKERIVF
jgi:hypothetical protein